LFSLAELARRRAPEGQADAAAQAVFDMWAEILAKPDSIDDFWMGHPHRRWSTFLKSSVIDELKRSKAKVYLAHGTADQADSVVGFDVMRAELLAAGRDLTVERVEGGDHGFALEGQSGISKVFGNVVEWFLR
jgi:pimeloyl-ACP methyl ester carboxylesterase